MKLAAPPPKTDPSPPKTKAVVNAQVDAVVALEDKVAQDEDEPMEDTQTVPGCDDVAGDTLETPAGGEAVDAK